MEAEKIWNSKKSNNNAGLLVTSTTLMQVAYDSEDIISAASCRWFELVEQRYILQEFAAPAHVNHF